MMKVRALFDLAVPIDGNPPPYLFGALLLFHTVSDNNVNNFPPEPLNYSLEAALLSCGEVDSMMLVTQPCADIPRERLSCP